MGETKIPFAEKKIEKNKECCVLCNELDFNLETCINFED